MIHNRVLNAAKPGHSADPVSAVTKKGKTLLGVEHPILLPLLPMPSSSIDLFLDPKNLSWTRPNVFENMIEFN